MLPADCLDASVNRGKFSISFLFSRFFVFMALLLLPPFFSMFLSYGLLWKKRSMLHYLIFAFYSSLTIISFAPIWDTITHYGVVNSFLFYNISPMDVTNYYYALELLIISDYGLGLQQYNYFCLFVFTFLIFCICCLLDTEKNGYHPICIFFVFSYVGLFFINGWTRFAISVVFILLAELFTKKISIFCIYLIFAFYIGYNFHNAVLLLLLAVPLYFICRKCDLKFTSVSIAVMLIFIGRFLFEYFLASFLGIEYYLKYLSHGVSAWYPSDYIVRPVRMLICLFFYYLISKNMHKIQSRWLLSLFLSSFLLQLIFICNYVIWERITNIALITGIIITYPFLKGSEKKYKLLYYIFSCFFAVFMFVYCLRPMFLEARFKDVAKCQNVALRTLYLPSFYMLNIEKYGFNNSLYDETTYGSE